MVIWNILLITVGIVDVAYSVSSNCSWTKQNKEVKVNCSGRDLRWVPKLNDSVTYLDLSHNSINIVLFDSTLKNLQFLDISWNHIRHIEISSFSSLTKLRFLDLSHCDIRDVDEAIFGGLNSLRYLNISYNRELGFVSLPNITYGLDNTKILSLNLNAINCATGMGTIINIRHLRNIRNTNLTELFLTNNRIELFQQGVISTLPKTIEVFSIAENKLSNGPYFLEIHSMSNLRVFNMSFQRHFAGMSFLSTVVSFCQEKVDSHVQNRDQNVDSYVQNHDPKTDNKKLNYNISITLPPNLEFLDLQSNRGYANTVNFTFHAAKLKHAYLQNNFVVSFGNIEAKNNIIETLDVSNNYCHRALRPEDGQHLKHYNLSFNDLGQDLEQDTEGWYIGGAAFLAILSSVILGVILVRNKWKIRYLIYKGKQRLRFNVTSYNQVPTSAHYDYDAFISYSGRELMFVLKEVIPRLEVNCNRTLLIRDRDYLPGIPKVDSIMSSLQESKRTICIVSKKYLESKWRDYELNMARVEGIKDRGTLDYVILILLPEVYSSGYPCKIMDLVRKDRYIEYPKESCAFDDFWDRLNRMIED
uniref:Toll-like receptor 13 n=1 Tax=Crassostrea virginica TaxID=6565 RepID=A0A8B8AQM8_CRAVI|nr:toll-like receptor 13 [Crassostrea virginica]